ncbi:unnamed protein product [Closterium sp. NIES-65]|nr:unnamed protein product [Closterium sp. NIES-65]
MLRAINAAGPNYVSPKRHNVGGASLLECKQRIEKSLSPASKSCKETGVTIASDMMQDKGGRAQMNIICINDTGGAADAGPSVVGRRGMVVEGNIPPLPLPEGSKLEEDGEVEADEDDVCLNEREGQEEEEEEEGEEEEGEDGEGEEEEEEEEEEQEEEEEES